MLSQVKAMTQVMRGNRLSGNRLDRLVHDRLGKVLRSAYANVPYYREMMERAVYDPARHYRGIQDLNRLEILTKPVFNRQGVKAFLNVDCDLSCCHCDSTSGSTGTPIKIFRSPYEQELNIAKWLRVLFLNRYAVNHKVFALCAPERLDRGHCFLQKFGLLRRLPVDYINTSPARMVDLMLEYRPDVIYGNRSHIEAMAMEMCSRGIKYDGLKLLVVTGEIIEETTKRLCLENFGINMTESYGCVEMGVIAYETPEKDGLHLSEDLTLVEFLDENGAPASPGEKCRIVMTDLTGTVMPLIRYDIGDHIVFRLVKKRDGTYSRRIVKIMGRDSDVVTLPDGSKKFVYDFSILMKKFEKIYRFQVIQQSIDRFEINIMAEESYFREIEVELGRRLSGHFGRSSLFELRRTDRIDPGPGGKTKLLISRVPGTS